MKALIVGIFLFATALPASATEVKANPGCTRVLGFSIIHQWYPSFETQVDNASYELFWHHGGRIGFWTNYQWGGSHYDSPCTVSPITRVVYNLAPNANQGPDVTYLVSQLRQVVANIRAKFPSVAQIVLQPIVGGPSDTVCYRGGLPVNATVIHPYAVQAINQVVNGTDVSLGLDNHVSECAMFKDTVGHLKPYGAQYIGYQMAGFFSAPPPLPLPPPTQIQQLTWDRSGAENLPCAGEQHWRLTPGLGLEDGVGLGINDNDGIPDGESFSMTRDEDGSFIAYIPRPLALDDEVLVAFRGVGDPRTLVLESCIPMTEVEPTPLVKSSAVWDIGFRVTTIRRTNVVAKWRILCDGELTKGKVRAMTPLSRTFSVEADACRIRVVSWDVPPHVKPHDWPAPIVTTFVEHL